MRKTNRASRAASFLVQFFDKNVKRRPEIFILLSLLSGIPEISPGGVQNEKIENPQTLPEPRSG